MTTTESISTDAVTATDKFSWRRAWNISALYPSIKWQMILYAALSLFTGIICYTLSASMLSVLAAGLLGTVTSYLAYFGSLVFARSSNPIIETTLPATNAEKCVFYVLYSLVLIPALLNVPYYAVLIIGNAIHPIVGHFADVFSLSGQIITKTYGLSMAQGLLPMSVCLYVLMAKRKNRIVAAVLWTIGTNIVLGIAGAIYGVIMAMSHRIDASDATDAYGLGLTIGSNLDTLILAAGASSLIISLIMVWLTCRKISHRQL